MVRKRQSTDVRKRQIIDAAKKVIVTRGSEHLTVKRIATEVGISETAIYRHFRSKKEILSLLADHIEENLLGDIAGAAVEGRNTLEIINGMMGSHLSAVSQRRGISFQVIAEIISLGDKKLNKKVTGTIEKYLIRLEEVLAQGVRSGELRHDLDINAAAMLLFGMIQGLVNTWALSSYSFDLQERYVPLWNTFREAIIGRQN